MGEGIGVVADEHLVAAVEGGFDDVGVLDIDAQNVGDDAADEGKFAVALAEDGFDAFGEAFALGFQILKKFLAGEEGAAVLAGAAELLGDFGDLPAEGGGFVGAGVEALLEVGELGDD